MCLDGPTGQVKWQVPTTYSYQGVTLKDVNNDGFCEILHGVEMGPFYCRSHLGEIIWAFPQGGGAQSYKGATPAITDIDGDGVDEVLLSHGNGYFYCLNALTGSLKWSYKIGLASWNYSAPSVEDIDGDGVRETLVASWEATPNHCYCFRPDGTVKWAVPIGDVEPWSPPVIDDVDGDGELEVVVTTYNNGMIYVISNEGAIKYQINAYSHGIVANIGGIPILDVDNDGLKEMFIPSKKGMSCYTINGEKWFAEYLVGLSHNHSGIVGDFDSDGRYEVFFPSDNANLIMLDAATGVEKWKYFVGPLPFDMSCVGRYGAAVADIDNDGLLELLCGTGGASSSPNASCMIALKG